MKTVVLISCVSMKLPHKALAKDLYISPLFTMNLKYAWILKADLIYILSAKYGLVGLEKRIEPYDLTLNTMRSKEIKNWADKVRKQMEGKIDLTRDEIIFLAGERYRKYLIPHIKKTKVPLQGLGIGKQLQYLKNKINAK